jgi:hypothetical protein
MVATDRALRALGREEPHVLLALVEHLAPGLLSQPVARLDLAVLDPRLDLPTPSTEADFVLQTGAQGLLHLEGQGYGQTTFLERLLRYHLTLVLRFWAMEVRSVALWFKRPSSVERASVIEHGAVSVRVQHLVLAETPAAMLMQPELACFLLGADADPKGDAWLCERAVKMLVESQASLRRWQMGAVAARAHGAARYHAMVGAMNRAGVESIIIEDLVKIGEDFGFERGFAEGEAAGKTAGEAAGEAKGLRGAVLDLCEAYGVQVNEAQRAQLLSLDLEGLSALRAHLKAHKAWPASQS